MRLNLISFPFLLGQHVGAFYSEPEDGEDRGDSRILQGWLCRGSCEYRKRIFDDLRDDLEAFAASGYGVMPNPFSSVENEEFAHRIINH
jgi:hypothetical protein